MEPRPGDGVFYVRGEDSAFSRLFRPATPEDITDEMVERAIEGASSLRSDDGHTDCYYRGIICAALGIDFTPCAHTLQGTDK